MTIDKQALRQTAESVACRSYRPVVNEISGQKIAAFIAAFTPNVALALLDELEATAHSAEVDHEAACSLVEENEELKRRIAELEIESSVNDAAIIELKQQYSRLQKAHYDTKAVRPEDARIKALTDMIPLNEPPSVIVDIKSALVELLERRSADCESVGTVVDVGGSRIVEWVRSVPEGAKLFVTPQPVPVVPDGIGGIIRRFQYQCNHLSDWSHIDEHSCRVDRRDLMTVTEYLKNLLRNFSRESEQ
ncbi:hypothetical protein [Salmonella enterica]|uniref:Ead/Ea22-like family protein n=1 Tax=Salmonella enterica I TaxID=59201 RepID=A0A8F6T1G3_SALET|nr:hypothetical protein [Salmonella enterica]QXR78123.1 ead/Ea22-like family protein [Salmonella enterica subsp. enterica]